MRIGMVGLGRMGANMATRLLRGGHQVVAFDRSAEAVQASAQGGAEGALDGVRTPAVHPDSILDRYKNENARPAPRGSGRPRHTQRSQ